MQRYFYAFMLMLAFGGHFAHAQEVDIYLDLGAIFGGPIYRDACCGGEQLEGGYRYGHVERYRHIERRAPRTPGRNWARVGNNCRQDLRAPFTILCRTRDGRWRAERYDEYNLHRRPRRHSNNNDRFTNDGREIRPYLGDDTPGNGNNFAPPIAPFEGDTGTLD